MPEGNEPTVELSAATQAVLKSHGFEGTAAGMEEFDKAFGIYKTDLAAAKTSNKDLSASQKKLLELESAAEEKRKSELSEIDGLREKSVADAQSNTDLNATIEGMKKSQLYNTTFFEHAADKNLIDIRKTLYAAAAGSQEWATDAELKAIFTEVDTSFEKSITEGSSFAPGDRRFVTIPGTDAPVKSDYFNG